MNNNQIVRLFDHTRAGHENDLIAIVEDSSSNLDLNVAFDTERDTFVEGDGDALQQLVWILLDNARKYGGPDVLVRLRQVQGRAQLVVSDNGPGFPAEVGDKVFERFYRAEPSRSPGGSGLGLAIAKEIVTAHGGSITASNQTEGGAAITVTLPLAVPETE